jgi:hypothetical protein
MPANAAINIIKCQRPAFAHERENVAQEGFDALRPQVDADPSRKCFVAAGVLAVQLIERTLDRERRPQRPLRVILLRHGIAEQRHQPVAELVGDFAAHFHDGGRGGVDIGTDQITPFLGVEFRRDARRVHQVAEHHRDMPAFPHGFGRSQRDRRRLEGWRKRSACSSAI